MFALLDLLFPPRSDERVLRGVSSESFLALLSPRPVEKTSPETVALFPFSAKAVRAAIHEAKYRGSDKAFGLLARAAADYLMDAELDLGKTRLVPVPLSPKRRAERGYNQVEEVARRVAGALSVPLEADLLERVRETESQVTLSREKRLENMRGAFRAARPPSAAYTYIVMDDVITTGATLEAAIDALREAGAEHLIPLALAH